MAPWKRRLLLFGLAPIAVFVITVAVRHHLTPTPPGADLYRQGASHQTGQGVERNVAEAARLYEKAGGLGNTEAKAQLCALYYQGRDVPRNLVRALAMCKQAAEAGVARAQVILAWMYEHGHGTPTDTERAEHLYAQAEQSGDETAEQWLTILLGTSSARKPTESTRATAAEPTEGNEMAAQSLPSALTAATYRFIWLTKMATDALDRALLDSASRDRTATERLKPFIDPYRRFEQIVDRLRNLGFEPEPILENYVYRHRAETARAAPDETIQWAIARENKRLDDAGGIYMGRLVRTIPGGLMREHTVRIAIISRTDHSTSWNASTRSQGRAPSLW